jgi:hypothetical protein
VNSFAYCAVKSCASVVPELYHWSVKGAVHTCRKRINLQAKFPACHTTVTFQMTSVRTLISPTERSGSNSDNSNFLKTTSFVKLRDVGNLMDGSQPGNSVICSCSARMHEMKG